jgi:hypothetical protein
MLEVQHAGSSELEAAAAHDSVCRAVLENPRVHRVDHAVICALDGEGRAVIWIVVGMFAVLACVSRLWRNDEWGDWGSSDDWLGDWGFGESDCSSEGGGLD